MSTETEVWARSEAKCELCSAIENLEIYTVPAKTESSADDLVLLCGVCREQIECPDKVDERHWRCLNESMWSQVPAVQVVVWRMLTRLRPAGWPQDLLDMLSLEESTLAWAQATGEGQGAGEPAVSHLDSNGTRLETGDTVTLIKDLTVKGANFTAKRGTVVRGIALVADNPEQIEARVAGQQIVILTKFVKKAN